LQLQLSCIKICLMNNIQMILKNLKSKGYRLTNARKIIINLLLIAGQPVDVFELNRLLIKKGMIVNKTTVYREINTLVKERIVKEIQFKDGKMRYEIQLKDNHHHHAVCQMCNKITPVVSSALEKTVNQLEENIIKENEFHIIEHSLEFIGICNKCEPSRAESTGLPDIKRRNPVPTS